MWEILTSLRNLFAAYHQAAAGKRSKPDVAGFEMNLEDNIFCLREKLIHHTYHHGPYHSFYIHDPKKRLISAAGFEDRVVHHALCRVIEPPIEKSFIYDSYANRIGKGTHKALDRCTQYLRSYDYYLQLDIRQYFPSIDHAILMRILSRKIRDEQVLALCQHILRSGVGVLNEDYQMVYFPGDDLFAVNRPRGLPIGNLTSQFWANVYLDGLDHTIKRQLRCPGYVRYVDDMLLFSDSKAELRVMWFAIVRALADLRLTIHQKEPQPTPVWHGVTFLGFRCFPDHRRLKRTKAIYSRRKIKSDWIAVQNNEITPEYFVQRLQSWISHAGYGNTWGLRRSILKELDLLDGELP
jgi:retron-type reverse transcriptase